MEQLCEIFSVLRPYAKCYQFFVSTVQKFHLTFKDKIQVQQQFQNSGWVCINQIP